MDFMRPHPIAATQADLAMGQAAAEEEAPATIRSSKPPSFFEDAFDAEDGLSYDVPEESGVYPAQAPQDFDAGSFDEWARAEVEAALEASLEASETDESDEAWASDCLALEGRVRASDEEPHNVLRICQLAEARLRFGAPRGAEADCSRAIALDPGCSRAFELRARARHALGDLASALADFDRALRLSPRQQSALEHRARLRIARGDGAGAVDDIDLAIAIDSRSSSLFLARAQARLAVGDQAAAIDDLNVAIAINPRDPESLHLRSVLRDALGRNGASSDRERAVLALARSIAGAGPGR